MNRLMTPAFAAFTLLALSSCSGGDAITNVCGSFSSSFVIKDRMGQSVSTFSAGEPISFEMQVTNNGSTRRTLMANGGCMQVHFEVANTAKQVLWSSADNVACTAALQSVSYEAGQTQSFSATWNQQQRSGGQAANGSYTASALDATQCSSTLEKSGLFSIQ